MATKALSDLLVHHFVDRTHGAADAAQGRLEAAGRHRGVGVDVHQTFFRHGVADRLDVVHRVGERDDLERRARRLLARQRLETLVLQRLLDGAQAVRPFGMAGGHQMFEAGRMREEQSGHYLYLSRRPGEVNGESGRQSFFPSPTRGEGKRDRG